MQAGAFRGGKDILRRRDVVVDERPLVEPADLGVVEHQRAAGVEGTFPRARFGEICFYHLDFRVETTQCPHVCRMLVDPDNLEPLAALEARDKVLADEASGSPRSVSDGSSSRRS